MKKFFRGVAIGYGIALFAVLLLFIFPISVNLGETLGFSGDWTKEWTEIHVGFFLLLSILLYTGMSFKIIREDEVGAVIVFGDPIYAKESTGLTFAPAIISKLRKESRLIQQREIPADPERVWHGDPDARLRDIDPATGEEYYVLPLRIPTGGPTVSASSEDKILDPLEVRGTVEPHAIIRWRIDPKLFAKEFIPNIGSVSEVTRQMIDALTTAIQGQFKDKTIAGIIHEFDDINDKISNAVIDLVSSADGNPHSGWGIQVITADIKTVGLSKDLNTALRDVGIEKAKALMTVTSAEAEKRKITLVGEANARAVFEMLNQEGIGLEAIAEKLGVSDPEARAQFFAVHRNAEALKEVANLHVFAGNDMSKIFGLLDALNKKPDVSTSGGTT